ncbi:MAG: phosphoribosylglycinamide formyltransferase [Actinobacteria bacterium]|nr:phosphoribosylglycinamide formyltransferase [Actinomycetota bacterium]MCA1721846.1 phosphoribosylglycinamide formyltransferase [Actinomycetota bacterium]
MPARLVVLASGEGTVLQALLDAAADPGYGAEVVAIGTDRTGIRALERAGSVPTFSLSVKDFASREEWDRAYADELERWTPDLVVCAGFMKILGPAVLSRFGGRITNTHPALLPAFPGAHPVRDTMAYGVKVTGTTVHFVDEGVDTGPIIAQEAVAVLPGDDEGTLHSRIKDVEHRLYVDTVGRLARSGWTLSGRTVVLP